MQDVPYRFGFRPDWIPYVDAKDEGVETGIILKDRFGWTIRQDAAVPIILVVDADGRKGRRQRRACHDVLYRKWHLAGVEIVHFASAHICCTDREPGRTGIEKGEIDELRERGFERRR